jgi:FKBP-type peptidyl-prolyl cis-trans isomerase
MDENKKRKEVISLPSGLQYEVLKAGMVPNQLLPTLSWFIIPVD